MSSGILIIGPAWVGDMVMAQSLLRVLRQRFPAESIDVVAPAWAVGLLERMPEVRRAIALDAAHGQLAFTARHTLGRSLRTTGYRLAIVVPRSLKSALVPFFAGIPERVGYRAELRSLLLTDARRLDRTRMPQTVQRFVALGLPAGAELPEELPWPRLRVDADNRRALLERHGLTAAQSAVVLLPGAAYGPAKMWPVGHYAGLARQLLAQGRPVWILGSAAERPLGEEIRSAAGGEVRNLCGETSLADTVDLLSVAAAVVGNDSGLMHLAAAAGAHVVALYGSTPPAIAPPLTKRRKVLYLGLECSPCFRRECPLGHLRCLRELTIDSVLDALAGIPAPAIAGEP